MTTPLQPDLVSAINCNFPLSHKQAGKYYLYSIMSKCINSEMFREVEAFNMCVTASVTGLNVDTLKKAIEALVIRHEILRTSFLLVDGKGVQQIHDPSCGNFSRWTSLHFEKTEEEKLEARIMEAAGTLFNFETGPLFRVHVIEVNDTYYTIVLVINHTIADAYALTLLKGDLLVLYAAFENNCLAHLRPLVFQSKEYAAWEQEALHSRGEVSIRYWKSQFKKDATGILIKFYLPSVQQIEKSYTRQLTSELQANFRDLTGPETERLLGIYHRGTSFTASAFLLLLPDQLVKALKSLSRKANVTLFTTVLSAVKLFLLSVSGKEQIVLAYEISNRAKPKFESLVGWLCNTVFSFAERNTALSMVDFIRRTQQEHLTIMQDFNYPFDRVLKALDTSIDGLGTVFINFVNSDEAASTFSESIFLEDGGSPYFDIDLLFECHPGGIQLTFKFRNDRFDVNTATFIKDELLKFFSLLFSVEKPLDNFPVNQIIAAPGAVGMQPGTCSSI